MRKNKSQEKALLEDNALRSGRITCVDANRYGARYPSATRSILAQFSLPAQVASWAMVVQPAAAANGYDPSANHARRCPVAELFSLGDSSHLVKAIPLLVALLLSVLPAYAADSQTDPKDLVPPVTLTQANYYRTSGRESSSACR